MADTAEAPTDIKFSCHPSMEYWSKRVFDGEYYVDPKFVPALPEEPVILDIGANAGSFSLWALKMWPKAKVFAYEPSQIGFHWLKENSAPYPQITISRAAITTGDSNKLYAGAQNQGQATLFKDINPLLGETYEEVPTTEPITLPSCNILKVDTEGCELEILGPYMARDENTYPQLVVFEYHREVDRIALDALFVAKGYLLTGSHADQPHRGVAKYVRR